LTTALYCSAASFTCDGPSASRHCASPSCAPGSAGARLAAWRKNGSASAARPDAHQHRRQVALGEGVLGLELDRVAQRVGRLIGAPGARERYPERDERVRVRGVEFDRPLQRGDRLCRSPQFGQTQPVAVGELGVVEHAVERLEHRQRILQEAVLQQPQHVGLRLDPALGDRDHAHERVIDCHHGLPAARRVVERVAPDHRLLELGRAAWRQARRVEVVERDLEDFGGLAGGHRGVQSGVRRGLSHP
jgi:hypothetical protein